MEATNALETLLLYLENRGIKLWADGERLRYTAAPSVLTPELIAQLRLYKSELIARLRQLADPEVRSYPASFVQRRFWNLQQRNPTEGFYNVPFVFRLRGPLDPSLLRQSFNAIVRRHDSLRTTLHQTNGALIQVVAPTGEISLEFADLQNDASEAATHLLQNGMERPFDLARETGLRVLLLQVGSNEFVMQLCFHNTLFDQNSLLVLLRELSLHYTGLVGGPVADLPPPAQYSDYVRLQDSFMAKQNEERLEYWRGWFSKGDPPLLKWISLPRERQDPGFQSHVTWQRHSPELTQQLKKLAQHTGVTLFLTLLAAYAIVVRRYTGCADLAIGTTYSNRDQWQFESLIGATINVPALRIDTTDDPSVTTLLGRVRDVVASAVTNQDVPFESIVSALQLANEPSWPLFRVVFSYFAETPHDSLHLPGIAVTFLEEFINPRSRPDLYLVLWDRAEAGASLSGYWLHRQDVFQESTAVEMGRQFARVLDSMVNYPTQSLAKLV